MSSAATTPVIEIDNVSVDRGGVRVLEGITFTIRQGEFVGLVGPNGAGKTTLLKAILGLVPIAEGRIMLFGRPLGPHTSDRRSIGYVPQRAAVRPRFPATVEDVVMMGRYAEIGLLRLPSASDRREVARSLEWVGISGRARRPVGELSGGEQRRVLLAQALTASTKLLLLDEPTMGLDLPAEQEFYALLRRLQAELDLTVLIVSHDLVALAGEADQLMCINRRLHVHGNPEDVIHSHAIREAYSCEFDFIAGELEHHGKHGHPHAHPHGDKTEGGR
jgi:zinc transport system ATP-binding protein